MEEIWREDLKRDLQDVEFARLYGAEHAKDEIAVTLAKTRINQGLTQKGLAIKVGASQPYIAKLERGGANPTIGNIGSMLAIVGLRLIVATGPLIPQPVESIIRSLGHVQASSFVPQVAEETVQQSLADYGDIRIVSNVNNAGFGPEIGTTNEWTTPLPRKLAVCA